MTSNMRTETFCRLPLVGPTSSRCWGASSMVAATCNSLALQTKMLRRPLCTSHTASTLISMTEYGRRLYRNCCCDEHLTPTRHASRKDALKHECRLWSSVLAASRESDVKMVAKPDHFIYMSMEGLALQHFWGISIFEKIAHTCPTMELRLN